MDTDFTDTDTDTDIVNIVDTCVVHQSHVPWFGRGYLIVRCRLVAKNEFGQMVSSVENDSK